MQNYKSRFIKFIQNPKYIFGIYIILSIVTAVSKFGEGKHNNYLVFKNVFWNMLQKNNLYAPYPDKYFDTNFYGPIFSIIIFPFALLPDYFGMILWNVLLALVFIFALHKLPFSSTNKSFFAWLCLQELITSLVSFQFNIAIAAIIILSLVFIQNEEEGKSALSILIGTLVKIYGIVGFTFFFFIKNKKKFLFSFLGLGFLLIILPSIFGGFDFNIQSYKDWYEAILFKNQKNQTLSGDMQNISLLGMFSRIFNLQGYNVFIIILGIILFSLPYLRISQYKYRSFQLLILSSTLMFTVLFSSSSESSTYIVAVSGVVLWFLMKNEKTALDIGLLLFVLVLTSFSMSDLFPKNIKHNYIVKYSLKAMPVTVVWIKVIYELLVKDFSKEHHYNLIND